MSFRKPSPVSGVIVIDKPAKHTSHDVVSRVRRLFDTTEVGHTGTLDPLATGVLPILIGRGVKATELIQAEDKEYEAELRLGITTDTEDASGTVLTRSEDIPSEEAVLAAVASMEGEQDQIPPMYSALKVNGQKLYDIARSGREVEREARRINVYAISAKKVTDDTYTLSIRCSKGTYIRSICSDIGKKLGCGGIMAKLRRTASGHFSLGDAYTLEALGEMPIEERRALVKPVESLFTDLPAVKLSPFFEKLFRGGCEIYQKKIGSSVPKDAVVRIYAGGQFIALAKEAAYPDGSALKLLKLFVL